MKMESTPLLAFKGPAANGSPSRSANTDGHRETIDGSFGDWLERSQRSSRPETSTRASSKSDEVASAEGPASTHAEARAVDANSDKTAPADGAREQHQEEDGEAMALGGPASTQTPADQAALDLTRPVGVFSTGATLAAAAQSTTTGAEGGALLDSTELVAAAAAVVNPAAGAEPSKGTNTGMPLETTASGAEIDRLSSGLATELGRAATAHIEAARAVATGGTSGAPPAATPVEVAPGTAELDSALASAARDSTAMSQARASGEAAPTAPANTALSAESSSETAPQRAQTPGVTGEASTANSGQQNSAQSESDAHSTASGQGPAASLAAAGKRRETASSDSEEGGVDGDALPTVGDTQNTNAAPASGDAAATTSQPSGSASPIAASGTPNQNIAPTTPTTATTAPGQTQAPAAPTPTPAAPPIHESGDPIVRLHDTNAGSIEARIRMSGSNLWVQVRAEDAQMREALLQSLPRVQTELAKSELVTGRVDVSEWGTDEHSSESGQTHSSSEDGLQDDSYMARRARLARAHSTETTNAQDPSNGGSNAPRHRVIAVG